MANKKTAKKKAAAKSAPAKKKKAVKKAASKKTATKKAAAKKTSKKVAAAASEEATKKRKKRMPTKKLVRRKKKTAATAKGARKEPDSPTGNILLGSKKKEKRQEINHAFMERLRETRTKGTPAAFKIQSKERKVTPVVFSLEDVREVLKQRKQESESSNGQAETKAPAKKAPAKKATRKSAPAVAPQIEHKKHNAASLADILGFNPTTPAAEPSQPESREVPKKWQKYYNLLIDLREHVRKELDLHTRETLKRSSKDDSGDLASFSSHMADSGTENFDRDLALSFVSSEQEALNEIEMAIERIFDGSYGICQVTGQPIYPERLEAVPFTRFSLEGQAQNERNKKRNIERGGVFIDSSVEGAAEFGGDDDSDE